MKSHTFMFFRDFTVPLLLGIKTMTIRGIRKRMPKVGDQMDQRCWEGKSYRSKQAKIQVVPIREVKLVSLHLSVHRGWVQYRGSGQVLSARADLDAFAQRDGFDEWKKLVRFFICQGRPQKFDGVLFGWEASDVARPVGEGQSVEETDRMILEVVANSQPFPSIVAEVVEALREKYQRAGIPAVRTEKP